MFATLASIPNVYYIVHTNMPLRTRGGGVHPGGFYKPILIFGIAGKLFSESVNKCGSLSAVNWVELTPRSIKFEFKK